MPGKGNKPAAGRTLPDIPKELLDQCVTDPMTARGGRGAHLQIQEILIGRALGVEMSHSLSMS